MKKFTSIKYNYGVPQIGIASKTPKDKENWVLKIAIFIERFDSFLDAKNWLDLYSSQTRKVVNIKTLRNSKDKFEFLLRSSGINQAITIVKFDK